MKMTPGLKRIVTTELVFPMVFLVFGIYHGLLQVLFRAGIIRADSFLGINYYQGLTGHGVINAILLTTFFAVAFGHVLVHQIIGRVQETLARISLWLMVVSASGVLWAIFTGRASVLYTFYPPLRAHPVFYVGIAGFAVGSWFGYYAWIGPIREWFRQNPGKKLPLGVLGILVTFILWQIATLPVAVEILGLLVPWSLGWTDHVNVVLSRTLFWFFGHPLVYFWLLPAYVAYYAILPKVAGGQLYSDFAGRFAFLMFLVFSSPLGLHHQFSDPGISSDWKGVHTVLTSIVAIPSMMTAFTLAASLEIAGKMRGGTGWFAWWKKLPYLDEERWLFPYFFCGLVIFIFGGATGVVNASYNVNLVVHNTAWVPAHFHLTVAGPVFLSILGISLFILPGIRGKAVTPVKAALVVPYLWMVGVMVMSSGLFLGGLRGEPRRSNLGLTYLNPANAGFRPDWVSSTTLAAVGGTLMSVAMVLYFYVLVRSLLSPSNPEAADRFALPLAEPFHDEDVKAIQRIKPWIFAAVVMAVLAYAPPIYQILRDGNPGGQAFSPDSPVPMAPKSGN
jgi:cytochrome c oxidase subunit 1